MTKTVKKKKKVYTYTVRTAHTGRQEVYTAHDYSCMTLKEVFSAIDYIANYSVLRFPESITIIRNGKRDLATGMVDYDVKEIDDD